MFPSSKLVSFLIVTTCLGVRVRECVRVGVCMCKEECLLNQDFLLYYIDIELCHLYVWGL